MSEIQGIPAAAPARCEKPVWVSDKPGAYIWSESVGLIGWCREGLIMRCTDMFKADLFQTDTLRLSPAATHALCTGIAYPELFTHAYACLPGTDSQLMYEHLIWGTFLFRKTQEPVLRNLIMANQPVAPSGISECLKRIRNASGGSK